VDALWIFLMSLELSLVAWLKADPVISGLVGARVYAVKQPPSNVLPHVVFKVISSVGVHGLLGASRQRTGRVRVTARSESFADCVAIRAALMQLDGFIGDLEGTTVHYIEFADVTDAFEDPPEGADQGTYERPVDLMIKYREG
jgi:hypothetical protein